MTRKDIERIETVRPSRDGDQFHYLRGARLILELLPPSSALIAVTVEGVTADDDSDEGLDVIDLALYYGSEDPALATGVHYRQFKHSTRSPEEAWTASGLKRTLAGFGRRFRDQVTKHGLAVVENNHRFEFETNRPIDVAVHAVFASGPADLTTRAARYLREASGLTDAEFAHFRPLVTLIPNASDFLGQRRLLERDTAGFLPERDRDASLRLKDLVTRKATTEHERNPAIRRTDVLDELEVEADRLYPAPMAIETPSPYVKREQADALARDILRQSCPAIIKADGGVGKSIIVTTLGTRFPVGSRTYVYDCFGNGAYRSATGYRHRPQDGLVQLANEMATQGLCDLLLPNARADAAAYVRAFMARVRQASALLAQQHPAAMLTIVVDAADNAEMQAAELKDGPSFPRLLLQETYPDNVRLVLTARPHRVSELDPPSTTRRLPLEPFSLAETHAHLRGRYPAASNEQAQEFHRLTSHNPRVQALYLDAGRDLTDTLAMLGTTPRTVDQTIHDGLRQTVDCLADTVTRPERAQFERLFQALATLRPFVPVTVIAAVADVPPELVRSVASDLGRGLLVRDDALQFRDEPTEDWFRTTYRPNAAALKGFVDVLKPLAATSLYVAAALPQLMLEAGEFAQLVELALHGRGLPEGDAIGSRDVELQRLQFALKAALRQRRPLESIQLACKAAQLEAADSRQQELLSRNTDLAARFLDASQLSEQVSRRLISGGSWSGSAHAYEAALLSGNPALHGDAMNRFRMAEEWLRHFFRNRDPDDHSKMATVEDADIAAMATTLLNVSGPARCARFLRGWQPQEVSYRVGRLVVAHLIDAARYDDIDQLCHAARYDFGLIVAATIELARVGRHPARAPLHRLIRFLQRRAIMLPEPGGHSGEETRMSGICDVVAAAYVQRLASKRQLAHLLGRYLPATPPTSLGLEHHPERLQAMRAYALHAALAGRPLRVEAVMPRFLRDKADRSGERSASVQRFTEEVGSLLPLHALAAEIKLARRPTPDLTARVTQALSSTRPSAPHRYNDTRSAIADEVVDLWAETITTPSCVTNSAALWDALVAWLDAQETPLFLPTLVRLARRAASDARSHEHAHQFAERAFRMARELQESAEDTVRTYVDITRAILAANPLEAAQYFDEAVQVASKLGEENLSRWQALLHLAMRSSVDHKDHPDVAARLAQGAEFTHAFVYDDKHFDWGATVRAMARLSPTTVLAHASRWADREFGARGRVLAYAVEDLMSNQVLDPRDVFALTAMDAPWRRGELLIAALDKASTPAERQPLVDCMARYSALEPLGFGERVSLVQALERHAMDATGIRFSLPSDASAARYGRAAAGALCWNDVFSGLDVTQRPGIVAAKDRYARMGGYHSSEFWETLFKRVALTAAPAVLEIFAATELEDPMDLRRYASCIPPAWAHSKAVRAVATKLVKTLFADGAGVVSADQWFAGAIAPFIETFTDLTYAQLAGIAVNAYATTELSTDAEGFYRLVGLLAVQATPDEALTALAFGLDLLEADQHDAARGPTVPTRQQPSMTPIDALAGYLWTALGSYEATVRWEAAHAVGILCTCDRTAVLSSVLRFAQGADASPFTDPQLHFYRLHAVQWLLFALRRAAKACPRQVAIFRPLLDALTTPSSEHVLFRRIAGDALLSLDATGVISMDCGELTRLGALNESQLPPADLSSGDAWRIDERHADDPGRFSIHYDIRSHAIDPLARCFRIAPGDVERLAQGIIKDDWREPSDGSWKADERGQRGYFRHHHYERYDGDSARDTLSLYLSYHAVLTAAGRLLATMPLANDPEMYWTTFGEWLRRHDLTFGHALWLADRRDPAPEPTFAGETSLAGTDVDAVVVERLLRAVLNADNELVVSGHWRETQGKFRYSLRVSSAFVNSERADALARALVSVEDDYAMCLPLAGDHSEVDAYGYRLKGWLYELEAEGGADARDPWAARVSPQLHVPATWFVNAARLGSALRQDIWHTPAGCPALVAQAWSRGQADQRGEADRGVRLVVANSFVNDGLLPSGRTLLLCVKVDQRATHQYGQQDEDDGQTISGIFKLTPQGQLSYFPRCRPARRKAGKKTRRRSP